MLHGQIFDLQIPESIRRKHWKRRTLGSDAFLTRDSRLQRAMHREELGVVESKRRDSGEESLPY
jgi:hypothetical protein